MCVYETNNKLQRVINNGEMAKKPELLRVYPQELPLFTGNVKCDVAFVPVGGIYTMNFKEAATLINQIKPKIAVPIHYGSIVGDISLGEEFKEKVNKEIEVELYIKER